MERNNSLFFFTIILAGCFVTVVHCQTTLWHQQTGIVIPTTIWNAGAWYNGTNSTAVVETIDDFVVNATQRWRLSSVSVTGSMLSSSAGYYNTFSGWRVKIYNSVNDSTTWTHTYEFPGTVLYEVNGVIANPFVTSPTIGLDPFNIVLNPGRYWVSVLPIIGSKNTSIYWGPCLRNTTLNGRMGMPLSYIEYFYKNTPLPVGLYVGIYIPQDAWNPPSNNTQDITFSLTGTSYTYDASPPTLNKLTITPQTINLGTASGDVNIVANFSDVSGISAASVYFRSPSSNYYPIALSVVTGTTWGATFAFPSNYSEAGTWIVQNLTVVDNAQPADYKNNRTWSNLELSLGGNDVSVVVVMPSPSATPSASSTPSPSKSPSSTPSSTPSVTPSSTPSVTPSITPSITPSVTPSVSPSPSSDSTSPSVSPTPSPSVTPSATPSVTPDSNSTVPTPSASPSPQALTPCPPCSSNNDCGNGRGVCVTSSFGSYCSCLSGFGGCDCSQIPSSFCNTSYSQVDALSGNFQANTTVNYVYPMLFVNINAISEESIFGNGGTAPSNVPPYSTETLIFFGPTAGSYPSCSYPNGGYTWVDFSAQPGTCYDRYLANMTWAFAKNNCGFTALNDSRNYTQTVTVQRKYNLNGILQRTEQTTRSLNVMFPEEVSVSDSNVTVSFPSADAFAAITFIDYNPSTLLWTVQVQTFISSPYSLGSSTLAFLTGNLAQRTPSVSISPCTSVDTYCVQTITYTYPQGSASDPCIGLVGLDRHTFQVSCSTSSCPEAAPFNITVTLNTGNACPATDYITFSETSLASYSDSSLSTPTNSFTINDNVWFGASVQTSEALISSRTLKPNSVCFQPSSGPCFYVNYSLAPSAAGKEPVFVVDLDGPGNDAYFNNLTEPTQFSVSAVVQVSFVGAKGLMKNVPQSQTVQTVSHALIGPNDSAMSSSSAVAPFIGFVMLWVAFLM